MSHTLKLPDEPDLFLQLDAIQNKLIDLTEKRQLDARLRKAKSEVQ